jgi:hypothetical protein
MRACRLLSLGAIAALFPLSASAQDPPPRIGPFVVDVRGTVPRFVGDAQLAASRDLVTGELPGSGFGVDVGAHVYVFTWKAVTVGLGAQATLGREHTSPAEISGLRPVTETFKSITPQLSLNFGTGDGWSYLSGGIGPSAWTIVPDNGSEMPADREHLRTVNYGGGARWFAKRHVAFAFDVRFHQIDAGTPLLGRPGSPRTTFIVLGAGVSLR